MRFNTMRKWTERVEGTMRRKNRRAGSNWTIGWMNKWKTNGRDYSTLSSHKRELCFTLCVYFTYYVVYGCCFCSCCFCLFFRQSKGRFLRYLSTIKVLYYVDERSNLTKDFRMISSIMTLSLTTPRSQLEKRRLSPIEHCSKYHRKDHTHTHKFDWQINTKIWILQAGRGINADGQSLFV